MENKLVDIIIIGAGPAGMSAAIYAARAGKSVALIDKNGFGGNIALSPKVENIPGFESISGIDFATNMYNQVMATGNVEHFISEAKFVEYYKGLVKVTVDDALICGLSVIFATGAKHKELQLNTKNIYYCVTCDGPMYKNKNVMVVGSGNTGATYALELATYCKNVYLCDITPNMCCEKTLQNRIYEVKNIFWKPSSTVADVTNKDDKLTSVTMSSGEVIKCNAIFGAIGLIPQTDLVKRFFNLDDKKYAISNEHLNSLVPNIFIAGDCRKNNLKQVVTACSEGAEAAVEAIKYINSLK